MVYTKQTWTDGPSGSTPISAARLLHMEDGIAAAAAAVVINPAEFGAVGDSVVDDTAAIQAAIDAAASSALGARTVVMLSPGATYKVTTLRMKKGVVLDGGNRATTLFQQAASTDHVIVLDTDDADTITIQNLTVNGNKANQTATNRGINIIYTASGGQKNNTIRNVYIYNTKGDGISIGDYARATHLHDFVIYKCDGYGLALRGADSEVTHGDIGQSGKSGVFVLGSSFTVSNVKAWYSGALLNDADCFGFWIQGTKNNLSNITSQENRGHGLHLFKSGGVPDSNIITGLISDSDNTALTTFNGVNMFNASNNYISGLVTWSSNLSGRPVYGASVTGASSVGNVVDLQVNGTSSYAVGNGSLYATNSIRSGSANRVLDVTYAATMDMLSASTAEILRTTLTGNVLLTAGSPTAQSLMAGRRVTWILTQDATGGRTITAGSGVKLATGFAPATTANSRTVLEFLCDGTNWVLTNWSAGV